MDFIGYNGKIPHEIERRTTMTRFEEIGVERQWDSTNPWQAEKQKEISCKLCVNKGLRIECTRCHIEAAHDLVLETKFPWYDPNRNKAAK